MHSSENYIGCLSDTSKVGKGVFPFMAGNGFLCCNFIERILKNHADCLHITIICILSLSLSLSLSHRRRALIYKKLFKYQYITKKNNRYFFLRFLFFLQNYYNASPKNPRGSVLPYLSVMCAEAWNCHARSHRRFAFTPSVQQTNTLYE